ncbi:SDR family oxidoreductase [uncultured Mailhella sp.]|uniref:SDR family NAD(P)-dependent oxidoreductase n=1 Tax=uncultured Mailhella sp. TaxID=1981031 RepID=UPI0026161417|nr:SDR family oxidoreductase [uncultured Mailhella sp.]
MQTFDQKVVLVTGASSGIGRATCRELAARGASVILLARREAGMQETMSAMPEEQALAIKTDLSDLASLPAMVEQARAWKGHIDGFIHCAGAGARARLRDVTTESMLRCMRVNVFSFVEIVRKLMRLKKNTDLLQVVAISSLAAMGHDKQLIAYGASKAALETAAKIMAVELASRSTLVNLIRPAFVNTPMNTGADATLGDFTTRLEESGYQPLGIISPEEVAQMAVYLVSPAAVHISGAIFPINGGVPC